MAFRSIFGRRRSVGESVGICFGPDGVAVAAVQRPAAERPRLTLCDFEAAGEAAHADALNTLVARNKLAQRPCVVALEPGAYQLMQIEAPEVPAAELNAALRWHIRDLIDFHVDDAVVDAFDLPGDAQRGAGKMIYVVAARLPLLRGRVEMVTGARLDLQAIDITELALRNIATVFPEDVGGAIFVVLERTGGMIVITRQDLLYLARSVELEVGAAVDQPWLDGVEGIPSPALEHVREALALEVQRSQDYYERYYGQPPVQGLVIGPLERELPGFAQHAGEYLGIPTRDLDLAAMFDLAPGLALPRSATCLTAIGAALRTEATT